MKLSEVEQTNNTDQCEGELIFLFKELTLGDLENYEDDIKVDGDKKTIIFEIY
jgi:hypothetical protein